MTTKTERIYYQMLEREVVTLDEVVRIAHKVLHRRVSRTYVANEFLTRLRRDGKVHSIRRGLYHVVIPFGQPKSPDLFLIASKVSPSGFLGYHTALEFYGSAHSLFYNESYVCVSEGNRFRPFSFSFGRRDRVAMSTQRRNMVAAAFTHPTARQVAPSSNADFISGGRCSGAGRAASSF